MTLSGSCGVVVFALIYCCLDLCCGKCYFGCLQFECFLIYVSCLFCVFYVWTVLVNCLLKAFTICLGEVNVFPLKFIVLFFDWLIRVLSSKEYVCYVCDPSVCLGVPSICQFWVSV